MRIAWLVTVLSTACIVSGQTVVRVQDGGSNSPGPGGPLQSRLDRIASRSDKTRKVQTIDKRFRPLPAALRLATVERVHAVRDHAGNSASATIIPETEFTTAVAGRAAVPRTLETIDELTTTVVRLSTEIIDQTKTVVHALTSIDITTTTHVVEFPVTSAASDRASIASATSPDTYSEIDAPDISPTTATPTSSGITAASSILSNGGSTSHASTYTTLPVAAIAGGIAVGAAALLALLAGLIVCHNRRSRSSGRTTSAIEEGQPPSRGDVGLAEGFMSRSDGQSSGYLAQSLEQDFTMAARVRILEEEIQRLRTQEGSAAGSSLSSLVPVVRPLSTMKREQTQAALESQQGHLFGDFGLRCRRYYVARKPVLAYKLASAPKGNDMTLSSETDWTGCLEDVRQPENAEKADTYILVTDQYIASLSAKLGKGRDKPVAGKGSRGKPKVPILDWVHADEGLESTEKEKNFLEELPNSRQTRSDTEDSASQRRQNLFGMFFESMARPLRCSPGSALGTTEELVRMAGISLGNDTFIMTQIKGKMKRIDRARCPMDKLLYPVPTLSGQKKCQVLVVTMSQCLEYILA
ncbi:hypothetical protein FB451DRAFT_1535659 [Mycena latifolia]|nr:hypothetical protein FB451DRAFT_1535659 [Mycena latifolia]